LTIHFIFHKKSPTNSLPYSGRSTSSIIVKFNTTPLIVKSFNTPQWVRASHVAPLHGVTSPQNFSYRKLILVKLTLHLWHFKLHLSILINRMISPQNCSYRKLTTVMLTSHLWQIIVKFNTTPLIVIKLLPSSILNLWQSFFLRLPYRSWDERC